MLACDSAYGGFNHGNALRTETAVEAAAWMRAF